MQKFEEIDIEKIALGTQNVRMIDVNIGIAELAQSIEEQGLLQPIIAGQRRLTALIKLGKHSVPAMVVDTSNPSTHALISLIENVQRVDIDERDRGVAVEKLVDANNGDYAVVARMLGKSEATIRGWSGHHGVPEELKKMKDKHQLKREEATKLTKMLVPAKSIQVAKEIIAFPPEQRKKVLYGLKTHTALEPEEVLSWAKRPPKEKPIGQRGHLCRGTTYQRPLIGKESK